MAEIGRFFDAVLYGEGDQAYVQSRFRPNGVLYEAGNRLAVSAPGSMFVRVATGEAMVEGFHYQNTTDKDLAIAANVTGSNRIDRVVLRLNRGTNTLQAVILQGVAGAGAPALTQVAGGTWELELASVLVTPSMVAVVAGSITDARTYGARLSSGSEIVLTNGLSSLHPAPMHRLLSLDVNNNIYATEQSPPKRNYLKNTSFKINQRQVVNTTLHAIHLVDRWKTAINNNPGYQAQVAFVGTTLGGNSEGGNALNFVRSSSTAHAADALISIRQILDGGDLINLYGHPMVFSFWATSNKTGIYGANIEQGGTDWRYFGTFNINVANVWEYKTIIVPWTSSGAWNATMGVNGLSIRFVAAAGATHRASVSNAWANELKYAASTVNNPMTTAADALFIAAPKLEVGYGGVAYAQPSRFEAEDLVIAQEEAYRYLYVLRGNAVAIVHNATNVLVHVTFPTAMRATPSGIVLPVTPVYTTGALGSNNISATGVGGSMTGFTYSAWSPWSGSPNAYFSIVQSSTPASWANGLAGMWTFGSGISVEHSSELT